MDDCCTQHAHKDMKHKDITSKIIKAYDCTYRVLDWFCVHASQMSLECLRCSQEDPLKLQGSVWVTWSP